MLLALYAYPWKFIEVLKLQKKFENNANKVLIILSAPVYPN